MRKSRGMSKGRRNKVYRGVLTLLRKERECGATHFSLCGTLSEYLEAGSYSFRERTLLRTMYPELFLFEPDWYWLSRRNYEVRETIVLLCIEMTKQP